MSGDRGEWLRTGQAAKSLGITRQAWWRWANALKLKGRLGDSEKDVWWSRVDVDTVREMRKATGRGKEEDR